ncbi:MAG: cytochrome c oxidase assembly protein, partial [Siculibacillus sp.]
PWASDLLADQHLGGGLAWGLGEVPMVAVALILAVQWARADDREAKRGEPAADRDGDAELTAYNAMLAGMADQDSRRG